MEKVNKMFKGMYIFMGIAGVLLAGLSIWIASMLGMLSDNSNGILMIILSGLSVITMLTALYKNSALFENIDKLKLIVARGHLSMLFGFSSLLVILANENQFEMDKTLLILGIFAVYLIGTMFLFFKFYDNIKKRIEESEKEKIDG